MVFHFCSRREISLQALLKSQLRRLSFTSVGEKVRLGLEKGLKKLGTAKNPKISCFFANFGLVFGPG